MVRVDRQEGPGARNDPRSSISGRRPGSQLGQARGNAFGDDPPSGFAGQLSTVGKSLSDLK
jgi:hypothetical protein